MGSPPPKGKEKKVHRPNLARDPNNTARDLHRARVGVTEPVTRAGRAQSVACATWRGVRRDPGRGGARAEMRPLTEAETTLVFEKLAK